MFIYGSKSKTWRVAETFCRQLLTLKEHNIDKIPKPPTNH